MGRYKQRTISDLLKQTSKLYRLRTTPVLEGKTRMQGPLDDVDAEVDYKELQVCGDCRNYLDASETQNCSICSVGYHNVCLEALVNADVDTIQRCYKCRTLSVHDKHQLASTKASTNEVVHDNEAQERLDLCRTIEDAHACQGLGTHYTAKEQPTVWEGSDANPEKLETVSSKAVLVPHGEFSDTVCKPPVSLVTNALMSNKPIQIGGHNCSIDVQIHEENKDGPEFEASKSEKGKALQNELEVKQRPLNDDWMLSTSCALTTQPLKTLPRLPSDCDVGQPTAEDKGSMKKGAIETGCVLEESDCLKTQSLLARCTLGANALNEEVPIGPDIVFIDDDTAVAKFAIAKEASRKLDSDMEVKRGVVLNASTLSDQVGVEAQMDTHIRLSKDCPIGLLNKHNSCEGISLMQGQEITNGEWASEVHVFVQEQMADRTGASVTQMQMGIMQDAAGQTACSLSTQRPAGLESETNADILVGLKNLEGKADYCAHQVLAPNLSSPVVYFPSASSPGKPLDMKDKPTLVDLDRQVVLPADIVHPSAADRVEADLDKRHTTIVNESGDVKEKRLLNVNPHQSAPIDTKSSPVSREEGSAQSLVNTNIKASFEDDVKVCDICGDPGYEERLLVCSECNEGAEHVYCVQTLLSQVSEGYWQCEGCRMEPRVCGSEQSEIHHVHPLVASLPSLTSSSKQSNTGNARSRLSGLLVRRVVGREKRRALKGIPSCQFPSKRLASDNVEDAPGTKKQACQFLAKRHATDTIKDAPATKKHASETSGPSVQAINMPTLRHGLSSDSSFKIPDTGKMKIICQKTLTGNGTGGQGTGPRSGGTRKLPVSVGPLRTNMGQSGQKGGFANSNNFTRDSSGATKATEGSQINSSFTALSSITSPGLKNLGASKSGDALPSFLLPSKSNLFSKVHINNKNFKATEVGMQGVAKEGSSGGKLPMASMRTPGKINSFKIPKTSRASSLEKRSQTEARKGPLKSLSTKTICSDAVIVKAVENKCGLPNDSTPFAASQLIAPLSATLPSHGASQSGDPIIHDTPRTLHNKDSPSRNEAVSADPGLHDDFESESTRQSICHPKLSTTMKPFENFCAEEDTKNAPNTSSILSMNAADKACVVTSKEVPMSNGGEKHMAALASSLIKGARTMEESCSFHSKGDILFQPTQTGSACTVKGAAASIDISMKTSQASEKFQSSPTDTATVIKCSEIVRDLDLKFRMPQLQSVNLDQIEIRWQKEEAPNNASSLPSPLAGSTDSGLNANVCRQETVEVGVLGASTGRELSSTFGPCHGELAHVLLGVASPKPGSSSGNLAASLSNCALGDVVGNKDKHFKGATNADCSSVLTGKSVGCTVLPTAAQSSISPIKPRSTTFHVPLVTKTTSYMSGTRGTHIKMSPNTFGPLVPQYEESQNAYPQFLNVWRGAFEVIAKGDLRNTFHGLQAHLSNRALFKVQEVAKKLQSPLQLQELPRGSEYNTWPYQFQKNPPNNDNIALYFFARDKERYEQSYKPLVDQLIKHDLALKGHIEDAELLIFPSNLLPLPSQCWNNFMFLWAVFRDRKPLLNQRISDSTPTICKQSESCIESIPMQQPTVTSCVCGEEDMQVSTIGGKNFHAPDMAGNKCGRTSSSGASEMLANTGVPYKHPEVQSILPAESSCQQALQSSSPALQAVMKETFKHNVDREEVSSPGKATVLEFSTAEGLSDLETQHSKLVSCSKEELRGLDLSSGYEPAAQKQVSLRKLREEDDIHTEVITVSISKSNNASQLLPKKEHGNVETSRHFPLWRRSPPALIVCPNPRERQEDAWAHCKLSRSISRSPRRYRDRSKQRGICEYEYERKWGKERMSSGGGFHKDKGIERERGRDRERERDWERRRRHQEKEWERGRERGQEREWERERRGRDWDRESEKVKEREQGRERDMERKRERERVLGRDRGRHSDYDRVDIEHDKESRHWHHPHAGLLSRSSSGPYDRSQPRSPTLRSDHTYDRYRWYYHSRSYSRSPDPKNQTGQLQERAESRDWSQNSCAQNRKSPAVSICDLEGKDESVMENKVASDGVAEEPGKFSQQGSSGSLCKEHVNRPKEWLNPIADLNVTPVEINGNKDDMAMVSEVAQPVTDHDSTGHYHNFFPAGSLGSSYLELGKSTSYLDICCTEQGESSSIAGKPLFSQHQSLNPLSIHEEHDYHSFRQVSNSPDPLFRRLSMPSEFSSSCLQFFPTARECCDDENTVFNTPDLDLALGGKLFSPPEKGVRPFFMKLLVTPEEMPSARSIAMDSSPNVSPNPLDQAALSLSLAIAEHTQHPEVDARKQVGDEFVSTSLCLFG